MDIYEGMTFLVNVYRHARKLLLKTWETRISYTAHMNVVVLNSDFELNMKYNSPSIAYSGSHYPVFSMIILYRCMCPANSQQTDYAMKLLAFEVPCATSRGHEYFEIGRSLSV